MKVLRFLSSNTVLGAKHRMHRWMMDAAGGDARPAFFSVDDVCPELNRLRDAFPTIRGELLAVLEKQKLAKYHEFDPLQTEISSSDDGKDWRVFVLSFFGATPEHARECPRTLELLATIPGVWDAFFSVLDPGKSIPAHEGPWAGCLRYHLGLVVPKESPPKIRVKDSWYTWAEGEHVMFDDSHEHEVVNHTTERRAVLVVDVNRPRRRWEHHGRRLDVVNSSVRYLLQRYCGKDMAAQADRTTGRPLFD